MSGLIETVDLQRLSLAQRLREAREYVGMSQEAVAQALSISRPAISNLENGSRKIEAIELNTLAHLYGCTVDFLLTGSESQDIIDTGVQFLARATKGLSKRDIDEVTRFAEFLRVSSKAQNGKTNE
jgi:transcriptional regulator with XRE-family HTH domain